MTAEELLKNIDWSELRNQKTTLLELITNDEVSPEQTNDLEGLLSLIDQLQDHAVDELNIDSIHVFDFDQEDPEDVSIYLNKKRKPMESGDVIIPVDDKKKSKRNVLSDVVWKEDEKVLLMSIINTIGDGQNPSCDEQTFNYFYVDYVKILVNDNLSSLRLTNDARIILDQIKNKLNKL